MTNPQIWRLRTAIEKLKWLQSDLELTKATHQTYLLAAECYAEAHRMKQESRQKMKALKC